MKRILRCFDTDTLQKAYNFLDFYYDDYIEKAKDDLGQGNYLSNDYHNTLQGIELLLSALEEEINARK